MKKLRIFESITDDINITKYRLETLSNYLVKYQDLKHSKRNSNTKSDIDYLDSKINSILKKINKFNDEFGIDFLKTKLKEHYDTDSFSVVLDESINQLNENNTK